MRPTSRVGTQKAGLLQRSLRAPPASLTGVSRYDRKLRRARIPKGTGAKTRLMGIPTFEDKVLQRAAAMLLGAVYGEGLGLVKPGPLPARSLSAGNDTKSAQ